MHQHSLLCFACLAFSTLPVLAQPSQTPDIAGLRSASDYEVSPRFLAGIALHQQEIRGTVYQKPKIYATFDQHRKRWEQKPVPHEGSYGSGGGSGGGVCRHGGKLWVASTSGDAISSYDVVTMKRERHFKYPRVSERVSQSFGGLTHDGTHLWAEWHSFDLKLPPAEGQFLMRISPDNGRVVARYVVPAADVSDTARGLEWDGSVLWLVYGKSLTAIDSTNGRALKTYSLPEMHRPSGLAWDGKGLWIGEFTGKLWYLPFKKQAANP